MLEKNELVLQQAAIFQSVYKKKLYSNLQVTCTLFGMLELYHRLLFWGLQNWVYAYTCTVKFYQENLGFEFIQWAFSF